MKLSQMGFVIHKMVVILQTAVTERKQVVQAGQHAWMGSVLVDRHVKMKAGAIPGILYVIINPEG